MNMKKTYKLIAVLAIVLMVACTVLPVFADVNMDNIKPNGTKSDTQMEKVGSVIVSYITSAAMVIAVVMIAVLGIKYMIGSAEEKADYKKTLVPLLVGAILVFGASAVAKIIVGLAQNFK